MNENWNALLVAILGNKTPEQSFYALEYGKLPHDKLLTEEDTLDMIKFKNEKLSYSEIGNMYCITFGAVHNRIKNYISKNNLAEVTA